MNEGCREPGRERGCGRSRTFGPGSAGKDDNNSESETTRDRALSDVIAFVLVFAIIIGSVGLLYTVGFSSMEDYQEGQQLQNAERAMSALADNFNDVQNDRSIQERSGELALREGTVTIDDGPEMTIDNGTESRDLTLGSLVYRHGSTAIAYEAGGVFRGDNGDPNQSVVVDRPQITCRDDTAIVSVLEIESSDSGSFQSSGGVELSIVESETSVETYSGDVEISVNDSLFQNGWDSVFEHGEWDENSDEYECDVSSVTVRTVSVDIEF